MKKRAATNFLPALLALGTVVLAAGLMMWSVNQPPPQAVTGATPAPRLTPEPTPEPQPEAPPDPDEQTFVEETPSPTASPTTQAAPAPVTSIAPEPETTPTPSPSPSPKRKSKPLALPGQVSLQQATAFDLILKGKVVGQITVPKGALVEVVEMQGEKLQVRHRDAIALLDPDATDLSQRTKPASKQPKKTDGREVRVIYVGRSPEGSANEDGTRTNPLVDLNMALQIAAQTLDAGSDCEVRLLASGTTQPDFDQVQASAQSKSPGTLRIIADGGTIRFRRSTLTFAVARLEIENCAFFEAENGLVLGASTPHVLLRNCAFFENQRGLAVEGNVHLEAEDCVFYANINAQLALIKVNSPLLFRRCVFQSGTTEGDLLVDAKPAAKSMRFEQCLFYSPRRDVFRLNNGRMGSIRSWTESVEETGSDWSRQKAAEKIQNRGRTE